MQPNLHEYTTEVAFNNYLEEGLIVAPTFDPYVAFYPNIVTVPPSKFCLSGKRSEVKQSQRESIIT